MASFTDNLKKKYLELLQPVQQTLNNVGQNLRNQPQFNLPQVNRNVANVPVLGGLANIGRDVANAVVSQGFINPIQDLGQAATGDLYSGRLNYQNARSPQAKLGLQVAANFNPKVAQKYQVNTSQQAKLADLGGVAYPFFAAGLGGRVGSAAIRPQSLGQAIGQIGPSAAGAFPAAFGYGASHAASTGAEGEDILKQGLLVGALGSTVAGVAPVVGYGARQIRPGLSIKDVSDPSARAKLQLAMQKNRLDQVKEFGTTGAGSEKLAGWKPGVKQDFDAALLTKDAATVKRLLPEVPTDYKIKMFRNISEVINKPQTGIVAQTEHYLQKLEPGLAIRESNKKGEDLFVKGLERRSDLPVLKGVTASKRVGNLYESNIGQSLEKQGYKVTYEGARKGLQDRGIDLIAKKDGITQLIQNKYRPQSSVLHATPVNHFAEDVANYAKAHPGEKINAVLYSNVSPDKAVAKLAQKYNIQIVKSDLWGKTTGVQPESLLSRPPLSQAKSNIPLSQSNLPQDQLPSSSFNSTKDPVQKIIQALKEAKPLRGDQEILYSTERAKRIARVAGVGGQIPGEKGYFAQLGQLKGELPKVQFEGIRKQIKQPDIDSLFNQVEASKLSPFEKITAKTGLAKLLGAEGGTVPTRGEISLLSEVFPKDFISAVLSKQSTMQKLWGGTEQALNLPRAMMATGDLSAPLRQGVFLIGRPKQWVPAFRDMFKYAFSEKSYQGLQKDIQARPTYRLMRENRLAITDMKNIDLNAREEMFMSNLAEKIPGFGTLAKGSNRAYSGFLNKLRADTFDDLYRSASEQGLTKSNPKLAGSIASYVNAATGRGELPGALQKAAPVLNAAFFSPRLMASRLSLLNPVYYMKLDPFVRKEALKSLFTFAGSAITISTLANLAGASVGTDPRSADFAKIKVGNTRFDPWGGFQQYGVAATRLLTGQMVSSTTGKEFNLGEGYKATTRFDIVQRFFESKEAPVLSFITSLLKGENSMGQKFDLAPELVDRFIPMVWQDMYDLQREWGPKGYLMGLGGLFGVGSQTYTDQIPMEGKTATGRPNVQWRQAPGLGETILNKFTGTQLSNIPQEQWGPLVQKRKAETEWANTLSGIKATVLDTGIPQIVDNPITGKKLQIYIDDGILKTKDITPKQAKPKVKKVSAKKPKKVSLPKVKALKIKKAKKIAVKTIKSKKIKVYKISKSKKLATNVKKVKLLT